VHRFISKHWDDSRRVWLPMQLALTPEEHDDQAEIDALIGRVIGRKFTRKNQITYLREDRVQLEIARSIFAARDYHVLWVHDYAGTRASGKVDAIGFAETANVFFPALTRAVARFDSTGKLTTYMVILDQNFYEPNNGRLWMTILEDPLGAEIKLPGKNDSLETMLRRRQQELRAAVAASRGLQTLAAKHGGDDWLRRTVKVHVDITQPCSPTTSCATTARSRSTTSPNRRPSAAGWCCRAWESASTMRRRRGKTAAYSFAARPFSRCARPHGACSS
jgi:hypothetical protein